MHYPKDRLRQAGLLLHNENKHLNDYVKGYFGLEQKIKMKKEIIMEDSADSVNSFFNKAADLHKNNKSFRSNITMTLLHAMVVK